MSTTTVGDLLARAETLTHAVRDEPGPVSREAWGRFDATAYRLLDTITDLPPAAATNRPPALSRLRDAYPMPLILLRERRTPTVNQYAAHHHLPPMTVRTRIRNGQLPATRRDGILRIDARDDPAADQLTPADPGSREPLDQLSATLGAVADLLTLDPRASAPPPTQADRDALAARVLALTAVTARHALARVRLTDGRRPLLIGAYAEYALDTLNTSRGDSTLTQLASFHPPTSPRTPLERLEAALLGWAGAARDELDRTIPASAVLADIAHAGVHLYAVADQITLARADLGHLDPHRAALARRQFRQTAVELDRLGRLWNTVTTLQQPTHAYATATKTLNDTLLALTHHGPHQRTSADLAARIDPEQAMTQLRHAATDLHDLLHLAQPLPVRLAASGVLFAPARALRHTPDRLNAVTHGRYIAMEVSDLGALNEASRRAASLTVRTPTHAGIAVERAAHQGRSTALSQADRPRDPLPEL